MICDRCERDLPARQFGAKSTWCNTCRRLFGSAVTTVRTTRWLAATGILGLTLPPGAVGKVIARQNGNRLISFPGHPILYRVPLDSPLVEVVN